VLYAVEGQSLRFDISGVELLKLVGNVAGPVFPSIGDGRITVDEIQRLLDASPAAPRII